MCECVCMYEESDQIILINGTSNAILNNRSGFIYLRLKM